MTPIVFSKPNCPACNATYRKLTKSGVEYEVRDVTTDPAAEARVRELGYQQLPVVETDDRHWSGFRPDVIEEIWGRVPATC